MNTGTSTPATPAVTAPAVTAPAVTAPAAVTTPAAVTSPAAVTTPAVTKPAAITPAAITPSAITPAAITPAAITPAAITPAAITTAAITTAAITTDVTTGSASTPGVNVSDAPGIRSSATAAKVTDSVENDWSHHLLSFCGGDLTEAELLEVAPTSGKLTEAHTYIGLKYLREKQYKQAIEHFSWVRTHGRRDYTQYAISCAGLATCRLAEKHSSNK
jgi:hypothetical protein